LFHSFCLRFDISGWLFNRYVVKKLNYFLFMFHYFSIIIKPFSKNILVDYLCFDWPFKVNLFLVKFVIIEGSSFTDWAFKTNLFLVKLLIVGHLLFNDWPFKINIFLVELFIVGHLLFFDWPLEISIFVFEIWVFSVWLNESILGKLFLA